MNKSAVINILSEAKNLINTVGWTQGEFARNEHGEPVHADAPNATCFCLLGAVERASLNIKAEHDVIDATSALRNALNHKSNGAFSLVSFWNDRETRTKDEVVEFIDYTIESLS